MPAVQVSVTTNYYQDNYSDPGVAWRIFRVEGCMGETEVATWVSPNGWLVTNIPDPMTSPASGILVTSPTDSDGSYRLVVYELSSSGGYGYGGGDFWHEHSGDFTIDCSDTLNDECFEPFSGGTITNPPYPGDAAAIASLRDGNTCNAYGYPSIDYGGVLCGIDYGAGNEKVVNALLIVAKLTSENVALGDWQIQARNGGGGAWATLKSYYDRIQNWQPPNRGRIFHFENTTAYREYRINLLSPTSTPGWLYLAEVQWGMPLPDAPILAPDGALVPEVSPSTAVYYEAETPALPAHSFGLVLQWRAPGATNWTDDGELWIESEIASVRVHDAAVQTGLDGRWKAIGCGGVSYGPIHTLNGVNGLTTSVDVVTDVVLDTGAGELTQTKTTLEFEDGVLTNADELPAELIDALETCS